MFHEFVSSFNFCLHVFNVSWAILNHFFLKNERKVLSISKRKSQTIKVLSKADFVWTLYTLMQRDLKQLQTILSPCQFTFWRSPRLLPLPQSNNRKRGRKIVLYNKANNIFLLYSFYLLSKRSNWTEKKSKSEARKALELKRPQECLLSEQYSISLFVRPFFVVTLFSQKRTNMSIKSWMQNNII